MVQVGDAPIHVAASKGHVAVVRFFVNKGVDVNLIGQVSLIRFCCCILSLVFKLFSLMFPKITSG